MVVDDGLVKAKALGVQDPSSTPLPKHFSSTFPPPHLHVCPEMCNTSKFTCKLLWHPREDQ